MTNEFNLQTERNKWFNKWIEKKITARCIAELKEMDNEFIRLLKENLPNYLGSTEEEEHDIYNDIVKEIDKLAGDKLI